VFVHDRQTGQTTRVSVSSTGQQANARSEFGSISADGRYVTFTSGASNLVPGDTNRWSDVFVHDRQTGQTTRVSVSSTGQQANDESRLPEISADGRYIAFQSRASNLVPGDTNGWSDVFVHDRQTGQTTRVSVSSTGQQADWSSENPAISADGRYVTFQSGASNLVPGDTNYSGDVFVHDRQTGQTTRVSISTTGQQANDWSEFGSISADGRYVTFTSFASNLVPGDTNDIWDVFAHDRQTGQTTRVSVSSTGQQANNLSGAGSISDNGRYVTFSSEASNLVPGDTQMCFIGSWINCRDVFVHDRLTGQTTRVSISSTGQQGNSWSGGSWISADGRYVTFTSFASNLVPGDTNDTWDVFVHDRAG
jgi:archaellum component FlaF (FlaF/FlaG flagellin family)